MLYRSLALVGCIAQVAAFGSLPGGGGDNGGSPSPPGAGTLVECEFNLAGEDHWEEKRAFRYGECTTPTDKVYIPNWEELSAELSPYDQLTVQVEPDIETEALRRRLQDDGPIDPNTNPTYLVDPNAQLGKVSAIVSRTPVVKGSLVNPDTGIDEHTVLFIRVNFNGVGDVGATEAQVQQGVDAIKLGFERDSYDRTAWFGFDITSVNIDRPGTCDYTAIQNAALAAAAANGFTGSDYNHVQFILPKEAHTSRGGSCGWAGLGYVGCGTANYQSAVCTTWVIEIAWYGFFNEDSVVAVALHELGHNIGLHHSGTGGWPTDAGYVEYGDSTDIMGQAEDSFGGATRSLLRWINDDETDIYYEYEPVFTTIHGFNTLSANKMALHLFTDRPGDIKYIVTVDDRPRWGSVASYVTVHQDTGVGRWGTQGEGKVLYLGPLSQGQSMQLDVWGTLTVCSLQGSVGIIGVRNDGGDPCEGLPPSPPASPAPAPSAPDPCFDTPNWSIFGNNYYTCEFIKNSYGPGGPASGEHAGTCCGNLLASYGHYENCRESCCVCENPSPPSSPSTPPPPPAPSSPPASPKPPPPPPPPPATPPLPCLDVTATMTTLIWANEISWEVVRDDVVYMSGNAYTNNAAFTSTACLEPGYYTVNMLDSYGDGWHGGDLRFSVGGSTIFTGTVSGRTASGTLEVGTQPPSSPPPSPPPPSPSMPPSPSSPPPSPPPPPSSPIGPCVDVIATMDVKAWGNEIIWEVRLDGEALLSSPGYTANGVYTSEACLPEGTVLVYTEDTWGDGWHDGSLTFTRKADNAAINTFTIISGRGQTEEPMEIVQPDPVPPSPPMPPPALPPSPPSACVPTTVEIQTPRYWAYEMGYTIDGTITHRSSDLITSNRPMTNSNQFKNNKLYLHTICLGFGEHSIELFDSYGDGWDTGYLSVRDPAGGANLVDEKTVTLSQAGPFTFTLAETQFSVLEEPTTLEPKTTPESP